MYHICCTSVCWDMTTLGISLMLPRQIGNMERRTGEKGLWGPQRDLDPGPLVRAKLAGPWAKLTGVRGLLSLLQGSNPDSAAAEEQQASSHGLWGWCSAEMEHGCAGAKNRSKIGIC